MNSKSTPFVAARPGGRILIPPQKARERTAAVCGAPAAAARRGQAFSDNSATLGIRTCCGWSFGHSRDPVVVPRCAPQAWAHLGTAPEKRWETKRCAEHQPQRHGASGTLRSFHHGFAFGGAAAGPSDTAAPP